MTTTTPIWTTTRHWAGSLRPTHQHQPHRLALVDVESFDERSGPGGDIEQEPDRPAQSNLIAAPLTWLKNTNHDPGVVAFVKRARRALPGDPEFGDPLSAAGDGGPSAAARVAE